MKSPKKVLSDYFSILKIILKCIQNKYKNELK